MACRAESASRTDSPRRREPGSGPALQRAWVLGSPPIRVLPGSRNVDRRLLASADLDFENLAGNHTRSRQCNCARTTLFGIWESRAAFQLSGQNTAFCLIANGDRI